MTWQYKEGKNKVIYLAAYSRRVDVLGIFNSLSEEEKVWVQLDWMEASSVRLLPM